MEVLSVHVPVSNGHILQRVILFRSPFKTFSAHWNTILLGSERSRSRSHCHVPWERFAAGSVASLAILVLRTQRHFRLPQSSSASRFTAGAIGFLLLNQCREWPET